MASAIISDDLDEALHEIEERHKSILSLEKQVLEIYQLFQDLATLVDLQQETLDVIELRVRTAKDYTAESVEQLKKGEAYQIKANKVSECSNSNNEFGIVRNSHERERERERLFVCSNEFFFLWGLKWLQGCPKSRTGYNKLSTGVPTYA